MFRSLIYYRRLHLAVALGAAVTTAVLTGALLVGDSVRGSLRALSQERLGKIDFAILSDRLFRQSLAADLAQQAGFKLQFNTPLSAAQGPPGVALLLRGSAQHASTQARAAGVNINGVEAGFFQLFDPDSADALAGALARAGGQSFASVIINEALRRELGARVGDQVLLSFKSYSEVPRASVLGSKSAEDLTESVRLTVTRILPDRGAGRFGLRAEQHLPFNAFVALPVLQRALRRPGEVNALLVSAATDSSARLANDLTGALHHAMRLEDAGLQLHQLPGCFALTSRELILKPAVVTLAQETAAGLNLVSQNFLTYLANTLRANLRMIPYSTITATQTPVAEAFGGLYRVDGEPVIELADDEIVLNTWAAQDLAVKPGDTVQVGYYVVGEREQLRTQHHTFRLKGVVKMAGLAADRRLAPSIPGVEEMENMQDWQPPFPVDLTLIRRQDEKYWDDYGATPKAFVSENAGRALWRSRFGEVNVMRFAPANPGQQREAQQDFERQLLNKLTPQLAGFEIQAVKAQSLQASEGATDFGGLFFGFSIFLIVSATLLTGLLFRLGVEQRAKEIGILLALGHGLRAVRRRFLREGLAVAAFGIGAGVLGAAGYAGLMITALRTWWIEAVGTSFLHLHVAAASLMAGAALSFLIITLAIALTIRQLRRMPATALLHGVTAHGRYAPPRFAGLAGGSALALSLLIIAIALWQGRQDAAVMFFVSGALLLIAGLAFLSVCLRRRPRSMGAQALLRRPVYTAMRNAGRQSGRSLLSAALVSCACFIIVAVGANRRDFSAETENRNSGTGGFALMAEAEAPLSQDLNSPGGRAELGFAGEDSLLFERARFFPFRMLPGEDASCLNLYKPRKPRVLGMTAESRARGGFRFQAVSPPAGENPWLLLEKEMEPGVIPAIGDYNSVRWILHLGLGRDLEMQNERGEAVKLRFVGLLQSSIFQSEIIISEENFLRQFPGQSGYAYFLIDAPADSAGRVAQTCENTLRAHGFDVTLTTEKLAQFQAVENTYLSVFAVLGGLGLLLGTLGLGLVLARNVIERRRELATLRAFGYQQSILAKMLLAENGFLIFCGVVMGTVAALLAVAPHLLSKSAQAPWLLLGGVLLLVFVAGMLASAAALAFSFRAPLLPALKEE